MMRTLVACSSFCCKLIALATSICVDHDILHVAFLPIRGHHTPRVSVTVSTGHFCVSQGDRNGLGGGRGKRRLSNRKAS